jgi:hypothetical protein
MKKSPQCSSCGFFFFFFFFPRFRAITGKSNLMDAISFVLGVRAGHLRGSHLRDLIHNPSGGKLSSNATASVELILRHSGTGEERRFERGIVGTSAVYRFNGATVSKERYDGALRELNMCSSRRATFSCFRATSRRLPSKSPKDFHGDARGDLRLERARARVPRRAREAKRAAEDSTLFTFQKKKGINAEKKRFKEQKDEAEKFAELQQRIVALKRPTCSGSSFTSTARSTASRRCARTPSTSSKRADAAVAGASAAPRRAQGGRRRAAAGAAERQGGARRRRRARQPQLTERGGDWPSARASRSIARRRWRRSTRCASSRRSRRRRQGAAEGPRRHRARRRGARRSQRRRRAARAAHERRRPRAVPRAAGGGRPRDATSCARAAPRRSWRTSWRATCSAASTRSSPS